METTSAASAPTELDLFKAEIFGDDPPKDVSNHLTSGDGSGHLETRNSITSINNNKGDGDGGGVDKVETRSAKQKQLHSVENSSSNNNNNGVVVVVTSPPPTDPDDDVIVYDDDTASSADMSRRSSTASGGEVTPQIAAFGLSSALSRVFVGATSPPPPPENGGRPPVQVHRINVTPRGSIVCDQFPLSADDVIDADIRSSLWQPMKPGYTPTNVAAAMMGPQIGGVPVSSNPGGPSVVIRRTVAVERNISLSEQESNFRLAIPIMPKYLAMVTAGLNILCPGLGQYTQNIMFYTIFVERNII